MKTLIELYDERPIENVLASEVFRPGRTVFLCPPEVAQNKSLQSKLKQYFVHRRLDTELVFLESSLYRSDKILVQLRETVKTYGDCLIDITGGTDAALFACGRLCAETDLPVFTYSRKRSCFYDINRASFGESLPCSLTHTVEDCFLMAGGSLREGRVDNAVLDRYSSSFDPFFKLYLRYRTQWNRIVKYIQVASQNKKNAAISLGVKADFSVKGDHGSKIDAPTDCLRDLEAIGFLRDVRIGRGTVSFTFKDRQIRSWLRDIGSVLELYVYKACLDTHLFNDVLTSAVVDWEGGVQRDSVSNEIDVMAMKGILPAFISCKTCEVNTEALNELAILRDRFGGHSAKAAIVTTQQCRTVTRNRASELDIDVIDLTDLKAGRIGERLIALMRLDP